MQIYQPASLPLPMVQIYQPPSLPLPMAHIPFEVPITLRVLFYLHLNEVTSARMHFSGYFLAPAKVIILGQQIKAWFICTMMYISVKWNNYISYLCFQERKKTLNIVCICFRDIKAVVAWQKIPSTNFRTKNTWTFQQKQLCQEYQFML